jgi:hypothetical protein
MNMRWIIAMACFSSSFVLSSAAQVDVVTLPGKAAYVAGEPIFVTVRIANTSAAPLKIVVPNPDSCLSAINVDVEGLRRSDLPPCSDPGTSTCSYNGPPAQLVEITRQSSYEMRRLLNLMYDLHQPGEYHGESAISMCTIRTATSCRLPGPYDDLEKVTCAKESLPRRCYSSGGRSRGATEVWIYGDAAWRNSSAVFTRSSSK